MKDQSTERLIKPRCGNFIDIIWRSMLVINKSFIKASFQLESIFVFIER